MERQTELTADPVEDFTHGEHLTAAETTQPVYGSRRARLEAERSQPRKRERVVVTPTVDPAAVATAEARAPRVRRSTADRSNRHRSRRPGEHRRRGFHVVVMLALTAFFGTAALPAYATTTEGSPVGTARTALAVQTLTGGKEDAAQVVSRDGLGIEESPQALDSTTNSTVSPTVQALAIQLMGAVASGRLVGSTPNHIPEIANLAEGKAVQGCGVDYRVLQTISFALAHYGQVGVSDINRRCTGQIEGAGTASAHYADGGGHALDFYLLNGSPLTGGDAKSLELIRLLDPIVPNGTGLGQLGCRGSISLDNFKPFDDTCNHVHIDFLNAQGSTIKY
ncbi:hypothetical protein IT072_00420 [Leifsonia sp. ZF2019]|uniref:hypothetical protein n=1 Tax=Leifsonia sp. ZF2019 TaxID=2781978 RepID=UPI001CBB1AC4|nr:hypothetical protein [Leifsonia sp. ZF2019]UAJ79612.1 hypothetical protein IT072_00420 [Leifsonia sp. ZF2019]